MKATKNMNGAARVAVQAKLDAVEKELRAAKELSAQRQEELSAVRGTVGRYAKENGELSDKLGLAQSQLKWVSESCRKHLETIQALEAKQTDHAEFVEKLELELDIAEEEIQRLREAAWYKRFGYMLGGAAGVVAVISYLGTL